MLRSLRLIQMFPYSSRRVAFFSTQEGYEDFQTQEGMDRAYSEYTNFNFDEADGLSTEIIVNDPGSFNYLLVFENFESGKEEKIVSRWFVIQKTRTTNYSSLQYRLVLRRDILSDFADQWPSVRSFIRKGQLTDRLSPLLFNKEDFTFNAIKRREILLPDETRMQWIVGYIARNAALTDEAKALNGAIAEFPDADGAPAANAIQFDTLDDFYKALGLSSGSSAFSVIQAAQAQVAVILQLTGGAPLGYSLKKSLDGTYSASSYRRIGTKTYLTEQSVTAYSLASTILANLDVSSLLDTAGVSNPVDTKAFSHITAYAGRTVYIAATKRNYAVQITPTATSGPAPETLVPESGSALFSAFDNAVLSAGTGITSVSGSWQKGSFTLNYLKVMDCRVVLNPLASGAVQVTLTDPALRPHLKDAPYDMFCIPYGSYPIQTAEGEIRSSSDLAWAAAVALVENLSQGTYDLQLLPYCPARGIMVAVSADEPGLKALDCSAMTVDYAYSGTATKDTSGKFTEFTRSAPAAPIIWCSSSEFSFMISPTLTDDFEFPNDPLEVKIKNETTKARLVSPNLSGGFDFSPMMNGGCANFRVDCTYRPFNPYIHVAPVFAHMYGGDFKDARGLVCGGDFSLPRITDAWETYQQSNKNYQSIFDREIQNLEVTQKYQRIGEAFGAVAGVGQGAMSGAIAGGTSLGPVGAAAGAALGGVASLAGGIADVAINDSLRREAIDYKMDLFGYQLGNIRALPYSLAKSAAQNANNRPFPFLEVYRASDEEVAALRSKIEYDGMSVGVIGNPEDYIAGSPCFIQCLPCGQPDWAEDSDLWNALCEELSKGCYVYEEALP